MQKNYFRLAGLAFFVHVLASLNLYAQIPDPSIPPVTTAPPELEQLIYAASTTTTTGTGRANDYDGPVGVTGIFNGNVSTAGSYDPVNHSAHREICDLVVPN